MVVKARKERGFKQHEFATHLNIAKSYLSAIENGVKNAIGIYGIKDRSGT